MSDQISRRGYGIESGLECVVHISGLYHTWDISKGVGMWTTGAKIRIVGMRTRNVRVHPNSKKKSHFFTSIFSSSMNLMGKKTNQHMYKTSKILCSVRSMEMPSLKCICGTHYSTMTPTMKSVIGCAHARNENLMI